MATPYSGNMWMLIVGEPPPLDSTCPVRSPLDRIQIPDRLVKVYQDHIDALINQIGRNVVLYFEPQSDPCPNCYYDATNQRSNGQHRIGGPRPFSAGRRCPWCDGIGLVKTPVTKCIKCLVKWNPRDNVGYGLSASSPDGVVRLKTHLRYAKDLSRADQIAVDVAVSDDIDVRLEMIRQPIPVGLRDSVYCVSYWGVVSRT